MDNSTHARMVWLESYDSFLSKNVNFVRLCSPCSDIVMSGKQCDHCCKICRDCCRTIHCGQLLVSHSIRARPMPVISRYLLCTVVYGNAVCIVGHWSSPIQVTRRVFRKERKCAIISVKSWHRVSWISIIRNFIFFCSSWVGGIGGIGGEGTRHSWSGSTCPAGYDIGFCTCPSNILLAPGWRAGDLSKPAIWELYSTDDSWMSRLK